MGRMSTGECAVKAKAFRRTLLFVFIVTCWNTFGWIEREMMEACLECGVFWDKREGDGGEWSERSCISCLYLRRFVKNRRCIHLFFYSLSVSLPLVAYFILPSGPQHIIINPLLTFFMCSLSLSLSHWVDCALCMWLDTRFICDSRGATHLGWQKGAVKSH